MSTPLVSIVIPVYNDPLGLENTLESLLTHTTYSKFEIIVVDNASTDGTQDVANRYIDRLENTSVAVEEGIQSSYAARNTGIEESAGEIICFLDADVTVTEGWLASAIHAMETHEVAYLAPSVTLNRPRNPSLAARYNATSGFPNKQFIEHHHYAPTACLFVTRALIEDVGRFDSRLVSGGDLEFGNRVHAAGYELHYAPDIEVRHPTRTTWSALVKRNLRIGRGHCQLQRYYPDRYGRPGIPPRPDGIRLDTYDASMNRILFTLLTITMTATRGLGYYLEYLGIDRRDHSG